MDTMVLKPKDQLANTGCPTVTPRSNSPPTSWRPSNPTLRYGEPANQPTLNKTTHIIYDRPIRLEPGSSNSRSKNASPRNSNASANVNRRPFRTSSTASPK